MKQLRPMLMVKDLQQTLDFYTDVLGFEITGVYPEGDKPFWAEVASGDVRLMFNYVGDAHDDGDGLMHQHEPRFNGGLYFTPDVPLDELHVSVKSKVPSCGDIQVQPYGMREFTIYDPNGYDLTFGVPAP